MKPREENTIVHFNSTIRLLNLSIHSKKTFLKSLLSISELISTGRKIKKFLILEMIKLLLKKLNYFMIFGLILILGESFNTKMSMMLMKRRIGMREGTWKRKIVN